MALVPCLFWICRLLKTKNTQPMTVSKEMVCMMKTLTKKEPIRTLGFTCTLPYHKRLYTWVEKCPMRVKVKSLKNTTKCPGLGACFSKVSETYDNRAVLLFLIIIWTKVLFKQEVSGAYKPEKFLRLSQNGPRARIQTAWSRDKCTTMRASCLP